MDAHDEQGERQLIHLEFGHRTAVKVLARLVAQDLEAQAQVMGPLALTGLGWLRSHWERPNHDQPSPEALHAIQVELAQLRRQLRAGLSAQVRAQVAALLWVQGMVATLRAIYEEPQGAEALLFGALELWSLAEALVEDSLGPGGGGVQ